MGRGCQKIFPVAYVYIFSSSSRAVETVENFSNKDAEVGFLSQPFPKLDFRELLITQKRGQKWVKWEITYHGVMSKTLFKTFYSFDRGWEKFGINYYRLIFCSEGYLQKISLLITTVESFLQTFRQSFVCHLCLRLYDLGFLWVIWEKVSQILIGIKKDTLLIASIFNGRPHNIVWWVN
jgi:hypothetical protein